MFLGGLFYHGKERRLHFLAVNDECAAENLMTTVLGVYLCKAEDFAVGERAS